MKISFRNESEIKTIRKRKTKRMHCQEICAEIIDKGFFFYKKKVIAEGNQNIRNKGRSVIGVNICINVIFFPANVILSSCVL